VAPRAVLDANVVASAFLRPQGPPGRILSRLVEDRAFTMIASPAILDEIRRCLFYPKVRRRLPLGDEEIETWVLALGALADMVAGDLRVEAVRDDPDDDIYVAAALEGRAGHLASGDRHLLALGSYQDVQIVTPRAFLELLGAA
jgi:putative PIN family toxin of toxin-antitoxin system